MARENRRELIGLVKSNKMDKTITVHVERYKMDSLYKKYVKKTLRVKAHDANNECGIGDKVRIRECRPLSKDKRWALVEILERPRLGVGA